MSFSSISDRQSPLPLGFSTPTKNSGTTTPTTTKETLSHSGSLENFEDVSLDAEGTVSQRVRLKEAPSALFSKNFTAFNGEKDFFDEDDEGSDYESVDSLSSQQAMVEIIRDKVETRGEVLSLADFKKVSSYSKKDFGDPLFQKLMTIFEEYEEKRDKTAPQVEFDFLEQLSIATITYLRSFAEQPVNKLDPNKLEACKLLLHSIDAYFIKTNESLTKGEEIISTGIEKDLITFTESSVESNLVIVDAITKKLDLPFLSDANLSLPKDEISLKKEARRALVHFIAKPVFVKATPPKLIDQKDATTISEMTPEELKKMLTLRGLHQREIKQAQIQLRVLQNHIKLIEHVTAINAAQKAQGRNIDVATEEGFKFFITNATSQELQAAGGLSPRPELVGATIVTDWNHEEKEALDLVSIE